MNYINQLLDNAPCGFLSFTDDGKIVIINNTLLKLLEYSKEEIEEKTIENILPIASKIFYQTHFFPLLKMQGKVEEIYFSLRTKSGNDIPMLINGIRREDEKKIFNDCIFINISHRIQYEDELIKARKTAQLAIKEQKKIELELIKAKEKALLEAKEKGEFLANMSHEIRTPMSGILGMVQILESSFLTESQKDIIETIKDGGESLLRIVNDILDFSKIESGMLALEEIEFSPENLLNSVCKLLSQQAIKKEIKLNYSLDISIPKIVLGDGLRLRQILINLVGNALKFTQKGEVTITVKNTLVENKKQCELFFAVEDTGIGIKEETIKKLFQPFSQADTSISRKYGGTGLGLNISKRLVKLMGGTIWIESLGNIGGHPPLHWQGNVNNEKNQGSTFYFTILVKPSYEKEISIKSSLYEGNIFKISPTMAKEFPLKILLAEDTNINQKAVIFTLKRIGYTADIANNGLEVLELLNKGDYDVILMDMQMPEMDGITATKIIRQKLKLSIWIIAMTANTLEKDRQFCLDIGMNDYISKPITIEEIIRAFSLIRLS
jgi:PAS domain S-box-containing protein